MAEGLFGVGEAIGRLRAKASTAKAGRALRDAYATDDVATGLEAIEGGRLTGDDIDKIKAVPKKYCSREAAGKAKGANLLLGAARVGDALWTRLLLKAGARERATEAMQALSAREHLFEEGLMGLLAEAGADPFAKERGARLGLKETVDMFDSLGLAAWRENVPAIAELARVATEKFMSGDARGREAAKASVEAAAAIGGTRGSKGSYAKKTSMEAWRRALEAMSKWELEDLSKEVEGLDRLSELAAARVGGEGAGQGAGDLKGDADLARALEGSRRAPKDGVGDPTPKGAKEMGARDGGNAGSAKEGYGELEKLRDELGELREEFDAFRRLAEARIAKLEAQRGPRGRSEVRSRTAAPERSSPARGLKALGAEGRSAEGSGMGPQGRKSPRAEEGPFLLFEGKDGTKWLSKEGAGERARAGRAKGTNGGRR